MTYSVRWTSFDAALLRYVKSLHQQSSFTVLAHSVSAAKLSAALELAADGGEASIGLSATKLTEAGMKKCRTSGVPLGIWTLPDEREIDNYSQDIYSFSLDGLTVDTLPTLI